MLRDRIAVITGASRGLGAGIAAAFAGQGLKLGLCSRSEPTHPVAAERSVRRRLDVGDPAALDDFAEEVEARLGPIDLWINNAGVLGPVRPLREIRSEEYREHLRTNVLGVFHGTAAFVRQLRLREGGGVLVNISSGAALRGYSGWSAYCAGKAAVDRLTECVQEEERAAGLRAYSVAPGVIDTAMQEQLRALGPEVFPDVDKFLELKRRSAFNTPAFVARHLLALAFDPAAEPGTVVVRLPSEAEAEAH